MYKRLSVLHSFRFDGDFKDSTGHYYVPQWAVNAYEDGILYFVGPELYVKTDTGDVHVPAGDYIIQDLHGNLYPCESDVFFQTT